MLIISWLWGVIWRVKNWPAFQCGQNPISWHIAEMRTARKLSDLCFELVRIEFCMPIAIDYGTKTLVTEQSLHQKIVYGIFQVLYRLSTAWAQCPLADGQSLIETQKRMGLPWNTINNIELQILQFLQMRDLLIVLCMTLFQATKSQSP